MEQIPKQAPRLSMDIKGIVSSHAVCGYRGYSRTGGELK